MALIDKASLLMVPSTYEDGTLYNVLPSGNRAPDSTDQNSGYDQTRADFTFDRGNNLAATRIDENGLIQKGRENVLLQSNSFDTTWGDTRASVVSGQVGYDGTNNAWAFIDNTANNTHLINQSITIGAKVATFSIYAKAGSRDFMAIRFEGNTGTDYAYFNLSNGTLGSVNPDYIEARISSVGNDWYRCEVTRVLAASSNQVVILSADANSDPTYVGVGDTAIYIQDAQVEEGLVATDVMTSGSTTAKAGVLEDMPRINYDANGENGALLLEGLRSNLITQSEYFGDSSWSSYTFGGASLTKTFGYTSPEGIDNAYKLDIVVGTGGVLYTHNFTATASVDHTLSVWMKGEVGGEKVQIDFKNTSSSGITGSLLTLTNQWKRYDLTLTNDTGTSRGFQFRMQQSSGLSDQTIYVFGAQAEASASYPSSYIPTHGAAVSRSADSCDGAGNADTFNDSEGVLYAEISTLSLSDTSERRITISNTSNNSYLRIQYGGTSGTIYLFVYINGVKVADIRKASLDTTNKHKVAIRYGSAGYSGFVDGVLIETDAYAGNFVSYPLNSLDFYQWKGDIKQVAVFNEALSDSELATLTTL